MWFTELLFIIQLSFMTTCSLSLIIYTYCYMFTFQQSKIFCSLNTLGGGGFNSVPSILLIPIRWTTHLWTNCSCSCIGSSSLDMLIVNKFVCEFSLSFAHADCIRMSVDCVNLLRFPTLNTFQHKYTLNIVVFYLRQQHNISSSSCCKWYRNNQNNQTDENSSCRTIKLG